MCLVWILLFRKCATLIGKIKEKIFSDDFANRHKVEEKDFTRKRKLPFSHLILFTINLIKCSLQDELDGFFKILKNKQICIREVSKSALCKAIKKLKHSAFEELNKEVSTYGYDNIFHKMWNGFRLLAIDGSTVRLPKTDEIIEHFGAWHPAKGGICAIGRVSFLEDLKESVS